MKLSDVRIRSAKAKKKSYKLSDGRGLYLLVTSGGSKYWRFDFSFSGRRKTMSLGVYPDVSLKKVRGRHQEARTLLADGINPMQEKRRVKQRKNIMEASTFKAVSLELVKQKSSKLSPKYVKTIETRLSTYIFPFIGELPISEITAPDLLNALRRIETTGKLETCNRIKRLCGEVFRYGIATGRCDRDPAADLKGALATGKVKHMATITTPKDIAALLRAIDGYSGHFVTQSALQFIPLVFVRPGELRHAEWSEVDFSGKVWRIPAEKMKMKSAHIVPLSDQALRVLKNIYQLTGQGKYIFPSMRTDIRPMSENTINAALRRLGYSKDEMTGHGFRAMASTNLNEQGWPPDVIERQLAHAEKNSVRAAYNHAEYLPERKKMMQAWANCLDGLKHGAEIIPIKAVL